MNDRNIPSKTVNIPETVWVVARERFDTAKARSPEHDSQLRNLQYAFAEGWRHAQQVETSREPVVSESEWEQATRELIKGIVKREADTKAMRELMQRFAQIDAPRLFTIQDIYDARKILGLDPYTGSAVKTSDQSSGKIQREPQ